MRSNNASRTVFHRFAPLFVLASLIVAANFFAISFARASRDRQCHEYGALLDRVKKNEAIARKNNPECPRCFCEDTIARAAPPPQRRDIAGISLWAQIRAGERAFRKKFDRAYFAVLPSVTRAWRTAERIAHELLPYAIGCIVGLLAHGAVKRMRDIMHVIRHHDE